MSSAIAGGAHRTGLRRVEHVEDDGHVRCAALGRVELDRCLECPFLIRFDHASQTLVCQFDQSVLTDIPSSGPVW